MLQEISAVRMDEEILLQWNCTAKEKIKLYQSLQPVYGQKDVFIAELDAAAGSYRVSFTSKNSRPYFHFLEENGRVVTVAERVLPLEGIVNFRDMGGYTTTHGQRVKWGRLYRSAAHDGATERDLAYLEQLGIQSVVDYRAVAEEAGHEDRQIAGASYYHFRPLEEAGVTNILDTSFQLTSVEAAQEILVKLNRGMVHSAAAHAAYRQLLLALLEEKQIPLVQHCTAGKDRVGVGAAIILGLLEVPEESIFADYLLSNDHQLSADRLANGRQGAEGLTEEHIKVFNMLTMVHQEYLAAFFDELGKAYGTVEQFAQKALGLSQIEIEKLRAMYLE